MREAQISSVAASVAAAASVAKAAVDAAKAIQDASNEALNQLGMFHDIENYGQLQGTGTRSSARLAIGQGRTANPKPLQVLYYTMKYLHRSIICALTPSYFCICILVDTCVKVASGQLWGFQGSGLSFIWDFSYCDLWFAWDV